MESIIVGTCGFCERQEKYFQDFRTVEIQQTFYRILQDKTLEKWKKRAPKNFIFSLKAFQGITHPLNSPTWRRSNVKPTKNVGLLRPTSDVLRFWRITLHEAKILEAKFIIIQLPKSFRETEESFENAEKFFSMIDRGNFEIGVELRGWSERGRKKFTRKFDVIDVVDPLVSVPLHSGYITYYRLHGKYEGGKIIYSHKYSDEELKKIMNKVLSFHIKESFVYFNNSNMCEDARRLIMYLREL
ncbi:DUF72 domain-containing protein [Pyrococcus sp. ST04]|uniref:DUF72 domain-containing protein n=1 Tax=Pyrococcus sp. ST04 TaxID=1183377 RepID=UPI0002605DE8|nr:DUF72 domain-containing protein [Pyrococcus sp. ST04]AFK22514.1 hypothetical protein Py04_0932 [Pyrococcus sp. ST04]